MKPFNNSNIRYLFCFQTSTVELFFLNNLILGVQADIGNKKVKFEN